MSLFNQFSTGSPLKSNGWLLLLPHRLCWTWSSAVAHRVAPHSVADAQLQRTFWLKWSLPLHKLRESVTPVNTIRCTRWPSDWWWPMTSYCIVLYFWNSIAGKSQLIIPLYSIITCSTTFNHVFIHLYINLYIITCQSSASSCIIIKL